MKNAVEEVINQEVINQKLKVTGLLVGSLYLFFGAANPKYTL